MPVAAHAIVLYEYSWRHIMSHMKRHLFSFVGGLRPKNRAKPKRKSTRRTTPCTLHTDAYRFIYAYASRVTPYLRIYPGLTSDTPSPHCSLDTAHWPPTWELGEPSRHASASVYRRLRRATPLEAAADRTVKRVMVLPRAARRACPIAARTVREALSSTVEARGHGSRAAHRGALDAPA